MRVCACVSEATLPKKRGTPLATRDASRCEDGVNGIRTKLRQRSRRPTVEGQDPSCGKLGGRTKCIRGLQFVVAWEHWCLLRVFGEGNSAANGGLRPQSSDPTQTQTVSISRIAVHCIHQPYTEYGHPSAIIAYANLDEEADREKKATTAAASLLPVARGDQ